MQWTSQNCLSEETLETLFDKLEFFGIQHTGEQTLFKNLAPVDFESIFGQE